jgi:uncharacterized protein YhbP (UPF0306 family)
MESADIEKKIREYIEPLVHLSLATTDGDKPWVCEVHFAYDSELNLYFRSLRTRRHSQEIEANPLVAGNIVKQHSLNEYGVGVYFEGIASKLPEGSEQEKAFWCLQKRLQLGNEVLEEAQRKDGHQFYKISVATYYLFGRFNGKPGAKYPLNWGGGKK